MNMEQLDIEECIMVVRQNDTQWFTMRKRSWDEHRQICKRQGIIPLKWECFKRLVMRLTTQQEMVDCGVLNARQQMKGATIIPFI